MSGGWSYALYAICSINTLILAIQYIFLLRQFINCVESGRYSIFMSCRALQYICSPHGVRWSNHTYVAPAKFSLFATCVVFCIFIVRQFVNCVKSGRYACPSWPSSITS
jgi:hypothetical protein